MPRYTPLLAKKLALVFIASGLWTGAHAQSLTATVPPAAPAAKESAHSMVDHLLQGLQLGVVVSHGHYSEPGLMQTQGPRLGIWAEYPLAKRGQWQPTLQGQVQSSAMQYSSPKSGELAPVPDHEIDLRLTALHPLGPTFASPWGSLQAGAYAGVGYRWHLNDLRGNTNLGHIGYRRINHRIYAPLGLQLSSMASHGLTASIEYTPALYGVHTSRMTDIGATQDATVSQHSQGWALRLSGQVRPRWTLAAYYRQWATQATGSWATTRLGVTQIYNEPASNWRDTGIQLGYQF